MSITDKALVFEPNLNAHVMIVYLDNSKLDELVFAFLNEGLKRKQFCVYATVNLNNSVFEKMSSKIIEFEENVKNSHLQMVDLKPYLSSIMNFDLSELRKLKNSISKKLKKRGVKNVRFYGDLECHLYKNENYNQCFFLEKWWQKKPLSGTKICPYPKSIIDSSPIQTKRKLFDIHDDIIVC